MRVRMLADRWVHVRPGEAWPQGFDRWDAGEAYDTTDAIGATLVKHGFAMQEGGTGPSERPIAGPSMTKRQR